MDKQYRTYILVIIAALGLFASSGANPIPTQTNANLCGGSLSCVEPVASTVAGTQTSQPDSSELCVMHAEDRRLLSAPTAGSVPEEPLVIRGLRDHLRTNMQKMSDLFGDYVSNYFSGGQENISEEVAVLPNTTYFTPVRRNRLRQNNMSQLLYEHAAIMSDYIRALDTVRQDQGQMKDVHPFISDLTPVNEVIRGMCHLLYGIHRILRICDYRLTELQLLNTTSSVGYEPPSGPIGILIRDLVILREINNYTHFAHYDLAGPLSDSRLPGEHTDSIRNCSSIQPQETQ